MDVLKGILQSFVCFFSLFLRIDDVIEYFGTLFIAQFVDLSVKNYALVIRLSCKL